MLPKKTPYMRDLAVWGWREGCGSGAELQNWRGWTLGGRGASALQNNRNEIYNFVTLSLLNNKKKSFFLPSWSTSVPEASCVSTAWIKNAFPEVMWKAWKKLVSEISVKFQIILCISMYTRSWQDLLLAKYMYKKNTSLFLIQILKTLNNVTRKWLNFILCFLSLSWFSTRVFFLFVNFVTFRNQAFTFFPLLALCDPHLILSYWSGSGSCLFNDKIVIYFNPFPHGRKMPPIHQHRA